jgi:hypothetical protein
MWKMHGAGWLSLLEDELCSFVLVVARCVGAALGAVEHMP